MREKPLVEAVQEQSGAADTQLLETAAKGSIIGLFGSFGGRFLMFLLQILVSRLYGPTCFGLFVSGLISCQILQTLCSFGLDKGGMRFMSIANEQRDVKMMPDVFVTSLMFPVGAGVVMAALTYTLSPFLANVCFGDPAMTPVLRVFSFALPFFAVSYVHAELSRAFKTAKYAVLVREVVGPVLHITAFAVFHFLGLGFLSVAYAFVLSNIVSAALMALLVMMQIKRAATGFDGASIVFRRFPRHWRKVLVYSAPLIPLGLLFRADHFADIIMLNILSDTSNVGIYAAAVRWVALFSMLTFPVELMFGPLLSGQLSVRKNDRVRMLYQAITRWMFFITLPGLFFVLTTRSQMMLIFGPDFSSDGTIVLVILLLGFLATTLAKGAGLLLAFGGHQTLELLCLGSGLALNVVLNALLIPRYGIIGAAAATATAQTISNSCRLLVVQYYLKMHPLTVHLCAPLVFATALGAATFLMTSFYQIGTVSTIATGIAGVLAVMAIIVTAGVDTRDKVLFKSFLERLSRRTSRSTFEVEP